VLQLDEVQDFYCITLVYGDTRSLTRTVRISGRSRRCCRRGILPEEWSCGLMLLDLPVPDAP
jgi:hypothetical protein